VWTWPSSPLVYGFEENDTMSLFLFLVKPDVRNFAL